METLQEYINEIERDHNVSINRISFNCTTVLIEGKGISIELPLSDVQL